MFRHRLHPSPLGLTLGIVLVAFWAALWVWFFAQVASSADAHARRSGQQPEMAGVVQAQTSDRTA